MESDRSITSEDSHSENDNIKKDVIKSKFTILSDMDDFNTVELKTEEPQSPITLYLQTLQNKEPTALRKISIANCKAEGSKSGSNNKENCQMQRNVYLGQKSLQGRGFNKKQIKKENDSGHDKTLKNTSDGVSEKHCRETHRNIRPGFYFINRKIDLSKDADFHELQRQVQELKKQNAIQNNKLEQLELEQSFISRHLTTESVNCVTGLFGEALVKKKLGFIQTEYSQKR